MKTYDAIEKIGQVVIEDGLCEAIVLKGSIGRGDDDEYSDIDMYVVVTEDNYDTFMQRRYSYLSTYRDIVFMEENDFGVKQMLAIYDNALHVDFYTVTMDKIDHSNPVKVYYDPKHLFDNYIVEHNPMMHEKLAQLFNSTLYYFVEASSAYARKNYPWAARIMDDAVAGAATLLRYEYDKDYTYLGLKKINEILPREEYMLIESAYANMNEDGFQQTNRDILAMLEIALQRLPKKVIELCNMKFYNWCNANVNVTLFAIPKN